MDPKQLSQVRRALSRARNAGGRIRYSRFVKESVAEWLRSGVSASEISDATGIGIATLVRWSGLSVEEGFRRVGVSATAGEITVTLANGVRLSSPTVALLIEALEFFK